MRERWKKLLQSEKKTKLIFIIGSIGILLIFLSSLFSAEKRETTASTDTFQSEQYISRLEERVHDMVTGISGVGTAKVMITLESTTEYVYENERKENIDTTKDYADGTPKKEQEKNNYEQNVILVQGSNGTREALLKTTLEPKVKGVVIVCQGGDNVEVEKKVTEAVATALDISYGKICVARLSEP